MATYLLVDEQDAKELKLAIDNVSALLGRILSEPHRAVGAVKEPPRARAVANTGVIHMAHRAPESTKSHNLAGGLFPTYEITKRFGWGSVVDAEMPEREFSVQDVVDRVRGRVQFSGKGTIEESIERALDRSKNFEKVGRGRYRRR